MFWTMDLRHFRESRATSEKVLNFSYRGTKSKEKVKRHSNRMNVSVDMTYVTQNRRKLISLDISKYNFHSRMYKKSTI